MKFRNLFFGALAGLAFAACSSDDETMQVTDPVESVKGNAYIAVRLSMVSDTQTRAWSNDVGDDGDYEVGSDAEVGVTKAMFFFFNEDGTGCANPYIVNTSEWNWNDGINNTIDKESGDLVNDKLEGVVVLSNATTWPVKMVAVLNPTTEIEALGKSTSLNQLAEQIGKYDVNGESTFASTEEKNFLMSNAVYYDLDGADNNENTPENSVVNASIVTAENIQTTQALAKANPVTVYVERVLAKVRVIENNVIGTKDIKIKGTDGKETSLTISVDVDGWWLDNTNKNSYLLKSLDKTYTFGKITGVDATENWWTDPSRFRSYWANAWSQNELAGSTNFKSYNYNSRQTTFGKSTGVYCFENTNQNNLTQLVVSATLKVTEGGNLTPVALVNFGGSYYTESTLKILLSAENSTVKKYYVKMTDAEVAGLTDDQKAAIPSTKEIIDDTEVVTYYRRINENELNFIHNTDKTDDRYYSYLAVKEKDATDTDITYYVNNAGTIEIVTVAAINEAFKAIGSFKFWNGGRTYFFLPINQYSEVTGAEGVIRNHIYELTITGVAGLGTPVPDPGAIIDPEWPTADTESHLAARVAILKYRVIKQDVNLKDPITGED